MSTAGFAAEHLVPHLVIGMHRPLGGVVLIDAHDVRDSGAGLGQHLLDVAVDAAAIRACSATRR